MQQHVLELDVEVYNVPVVEINEPGCSLLHVLLTHRLILVATEMNVTQEEGAVHMLGVVSAQSTLHREAPWIHVKRSQENPRKKTTALEAF